MKKGIIKISGKVTDITYQHDTCRITLNYRSVYEKLFDETEYLQVEDWPRDQSRSVEILYNGASSISKDVLQKIGLSDEDINIYGFGAKIDEIHRTNQIEVYVLWHTVERFGYEETRVTDKVIIINHTSQPEQLHSLVERIGLRTQTEQ